MKLDNLSLTQRLRLTEALRQTTHADKLLTPDEIMSTVAPVLDELKIPAEHADALVSGIVASFNDGSKVDPESHKLLSAAAAGFELGNKTDDEKLLGNMVDLMKEGWSFAARKEGGGTPKWMGAQETMDFIRSDKSAREGATLSVHGIFGTGVSNTHTVETELGYQRQIVPQTTSKEFRVSSFDELQVLVDRGLKEKPGKTRYEDIGQGLDANGHIPNRS